MESIELKMREVDNPQFPVVLTKQMVQILHEPEMSIEVKAGQIAENVCNTLDSLGYQITAKKPMDGWVMLKAVKPRK